MRVSISKRTQLSELKAEERGALLSPHVGEHRGTPEDSENEGMSEWKGVFCPQPNPILTCMNQLRAKEGMDPAWADTEAGLSRGLERDLRFLVVCALSSYPKCRYFTLVKSFHNSVESFYHPHFTDKNTDAQEGPAQRWKLFGGNILRLTLPSILGLDSALEQPCLQGDPRLCFTRVSPGLHLWSLYSSSICGRSISRNSTSFCSQNMPQLG